MEWWKSLCGLDFTLEGPGEDGKREHRRRRGGCVVLSRWDSVRDFCVQKLRQAGRLKSGPSLGRRGP